MTILFICNQGKHRSRTAAELFNGNFAGIYSEENPVTKHLLDSYSEVVVFEDIQRKWIGENFPKQYLQKRILCLDIPDIYSYMDEKLQKQLMEKMKNERC